MNCYEIDASSLKERILPSEFYSHTLGAVLPSSFGRWVTPNCTCPFHADKKPGSFKVNLETGAFTCFSCGAKGGDIISFTMLKEGLPFTAALRQLCSEWGLT